MEWLSKKLVLAIHARQIAEHGGDDGIRDEGLLESALARAQNQWAYQEPKPNIAALAAAYAYGIARNHPFVDGNKRTAFVACRLFLMINNCDIEATQEEKYTTFLSLAAGDLSEQELVDWIESKLTINTNGLVQETKANYSG